MGQEAFIVGDRRLTPAMRSRKLQALDFIKRYFAQWGKSPSLSEVGAALGGVSRERARQLVHQLAREHMIKHARGKARGISLVDRSEEFSVADALLCLASEGWRIVQEGRTLTKGTLTELPFLDHDPAAGVGNHDGGIETETAAARSPHRRATRGGQPGGRP